MSISLTRELELEEKIGVLERSIEEALVDKMDVNFVIFPDKDNWIMIYNIDPENVRGHYRGKCRELREKVERVVERNYSQHGIGIEFKGPKVIAKKSGGVSLRYCYGFAIITKTKGVDLGNETEFRYNLLRDIEKVVSEYTSRLR
ncbi:hypothetical protein GF396_03990 [Candidatus Pacearchaeota archaeon]|nr:hypothetical protein [Candidatus Pacearchaeota archaeon]